MEKLKLSDAFEELDETGEFEWTATLININYGCSQELMTKCRVLEEYSIFIRRVREYNDVERDLAAAIHNAMDDCIRENILKDLLIEQKGCS